MADEIRYRLTADAAQLRTEVAGAERAFSTFGRTVDRESSAISASADTLARGLSAIGPALGALAGVAAVNQIRQLALGFIDQADALGKLARSSGMAVEQLSALAEVGRYSDQSAQSIAQAVNFMSKRLAEASEEGKGAAAAVRALGIDFDRFAKMSPADRLQAVAVAMQAFEDGAGKSAAAMKLFGSSEILPFLQDLASKGTGAAVVTAEMAAQAEQFNDTLEASRARTENFARGIALQLLPSLNAMLDLSNDIGSALGDYMASGAQSAGESFDGLGVAMAGVGTVMEATTVLGANVAFVVRGIGTELGGIAAQAAALLRRDFAQAGAIRLQMIADGEAARARLEAFEQRVLGATDRMLAQREAARSAASATSGLGDAAQKAGRQLEFTAGAGTIGAFQQLGSEIAKITREIEARVVAGGKLTKAQELELSLAEKIAAAGQKLSAGEVARLKVAAAAAVAAQRQADATEALAKVEEQYAQTRQKSLAALQSALAANGRELQQLRDQYIRVTAGNLVLEDQVDLRYEAAAAAAEQMAATMALAGESEIEIAAQRQVAQSLLEIVALRRQVAGATAENEARESNLRAAQAAANDWKAATDDVRGALTDAIRRGLEAGKGGIKAFGDALANEVQTRLLSALAASFSDSAIALLFGAAAGGGSSAGGGGGNWLQGASTASNIYSLYSGNGGLVGSAGRAALNTGWGSSLWYGSGAGLASGGGAAAGIGGASAGAIMGDGSGAIAAGASGSGSMGASSASWGAYGAYAAMIYAAAMYGSSLYDKGYTGSKNLEDSWWYDVGIEKYKTKLLKDLGLSDKWSEILGGSVRLNHSMEKLGVLSTPHMGGYVSVSGIDQAVTDLTKAQGGIQQPEVQAMLGEFTTGIVKTFNTLTDTFGVGRIGSARSILESDNRDPSWGIFQVQDKAGQRIGGFDALGTLPRNPAEAWQAFQGQTAEAMAKTLIDMDLPTWVDKRLGSFMQSEDFTSLDTGGKKMTAMLAQLAGIEQFQQSLVKLGDAVKPMGGSFAQIAALSSDAAFSLVEMAGGLETFGQRTQSYLQNYYSAEERTGVIREQLGESIKQFGLTLPDTREGFRAMVESLDLSTDSGAKAFTALMSIEGAFAAITPAAQGAGEAVGALGRSLADIASERYGLETQLLQLQGNTTELRRRELDKLDPSNRDLQQEIWRLEDLKAAQQAWSGAGSAAETAAASAQSAWESVWQAMGDEIRRLRGGSGAQAAAALQREFAIATAAARAGDIEAAKALPGLSKQLSDVALKTSRTRTEADITQSRLAASLETTLRVTNATDEHLQGLRVDVQAMHVGMQAMHADVVAALAHVAGQARQTTKLLQQFNVDGLPATRE